eukprot:scaffold7945_cov119-Isochrysis_galbana.AAC.1
MGVWTVIVLGCFGIWSVGAPTTYSDRKKSFDVRVSGPPCGYEISWKFPFFSPGSFPSILVPRAGHSGPGGTGWGWRLPGPGQGGAGCQAGVGQAGDWAVQYGLPAYRLYTLYRAETSCRAP